jgi:hypothetical protein
MLAAQSYSDQCDSLPIRESDFKYFDENHALKREWIRSEKR